MEKILSPFSEELVKKVMKELLLEEEKYILHASLAAFWGDGLAIYEIFNFLSPSSNLFCQMCLYTRQNLHNGSIEIKQSRNIAVYNEHLNVLHNANYSNNS